jgi:uncharacterized protein YbjT (DUF2867 family)
VSTAPDEGLAKGLAVVLFGATGMVGQGALLECIDDPRVRAVLVIGRSSCGVTHPKVRELVRADLFHYDDLRGELAGYDACLFCLGVASAGMDEPSYTRITLDIAASAADALGAANPGIRFCFVSGVGADPSERGRVMWARVKGRTENRLLATPTVDAYIFRPAYIQPLRGVRSRTPQYRWFYTVMGPLYPLIAAVLPGSVTTTVNLGRALIGVALRGYSSRILESREINEAASWR